MTQYYYSVGTERKGPVDLNTLRAEPITRSTLVWYEGMSDWKPASEFPELSDLFIVQSGSSSFSDSNPQADSDITAAPRYDVPPPAPSNYPAASNPGPRMESAQERTPQRTGYNQMGGAPPKTWLVESILVTVLCCLPFGIAGIVNASKVESRFYAGDSSGAMHYSREAGKWTKIGLWVGLTVYVLYFGFMFFFAGLGALID